MASKPATRPAGRNAETGRFTTVEKARNNPKTHVVERVPVPRPEPTKKK